MNIPITRFISKILPLAAALIVLLAFIACDRPQGAIQEGSPTTFERIIREKTVRAAYIVYPPTVSVGADASRPSGFLVEIMDEIAKRADWKVSYEAVTFDDLKAAIHSARFDIIVGGVFINVARAREMAFTVPIVYWSGVSAMTTRERSPLYKSLADADKDGVRVAVTAGTAEHDFVKQHLKAATINAIPNGDLALTLAEVNAGRADIAFADFVTISKYIETKPTLSIAFDGKPFNTLAAAFVIKQGDTRWQDFLNASISSLHTDGTIAQLSAKYDGDKLWSLPQIPWK